MDDSEKLDEILYLQRLAEWRLREPHMTALCSINWDSPQVKIENEMWTKWFESKPKRNNE